MSKMSESRESRAVREHTEVKSAFHVERDGHQEFSAPEVKIPQQSVAETAYSETKAHVLETYKNSISESRKEDLEALDTNEKLQVLSVNEYSNRFPGANPLVMGHCDSEGNIYIKAVSENAVSHISTHETMHLCSNRESGLNERGNWCIKSGLRETEIAPNRTIISDTGRAANEGATEMYTLRELKQRGEVEAAQAMEAYPQLREWVERLEQIVGEEQLADGYFGPQKEALVAEFNRFDTEDKNAWETFTKNMDIVEYGTDAKEIQQAQQELAEQYFRMILEKDLKEGMS